MPEPIDPIKFIDTMVLLVRSNRKLENVLTDLTKIAAYVTLEARGDPPDFEFRLGMKTGEYIGVGTDPRDAILMALNRAAEALRGAKEDVER